MDDDIVDPLDDEIDTMLSNMARDDVELLEPPGDLWSKIEAATASDTAPVISLDSRRRRPTWLLSTAAASAVLFVIGIVAVNSGGTDDKVIAVAQLGYDAKNFDSLGAQASGSAELIEEGDRFVVDLAATQLPTPDEDADLEVWLIRPDADGNVADLVSLGVVDPNDPGAFAVPSSHDPGTYFVVDISVEPRDGVATHSGRSILRGPLSET